MSQIGWEQETEPQPEPQAAPTPEPKAAGETAASPSSGPSSRNSTPPPVPPLDASPAPGITTRSASASEDVEVPRELERLVALALSAASSGVTFVARRRGGQLDFRMSPGEAARCSRPVARLVAHFFGVRQAARQVVDAADAGEGLLGYVFRVLSGPAVGAPMPGYAQGPTARAPEAASVYLHDDEDAPPPPPPPPAAAAAPIHDRDGKAVPGSGPARAAFLSGFGEL
jgi:hypothetical protein